MEALKISAIQYRQVIMIRTVQYQILNKESPSKLIIGILTSGINNFFLCDIIPLYLQHLLSTGIHFYIAIALSSTYYNDIIRTN